MSFGMPAKAGEDSTWSWDRPPVRREDSPPIRIRALDVESRSRRGKRLAVGLVVLAAVALAVHARIPGFTDGDSLYHIRHAWEYRTRGPFQTGFRWLPFSVIEREHANLWYGFHVLLVPLTFGDLLQGIRVGAFLVTFASLVLAWTALAKLGVRAPLVWTLLFAFLTVDSLYRLTMLRPQPLSLGIAMVVFALLASDRPSRRALFLLGAALTWIHLSLAWLPVGLWIATSAARLLRRRSVHWTPGVALAAGLVVGAFARPNPMGALRLATVQIPIWLAQKGGAVLLHVGRELLPYEGKDFGERLIPATVVAVSAIALFLVRRPAKAEDDRRAVAGWASLALTPAYFAMSFLVAKRANDLFVAFAVILAACAAEPWIAAAREARSLAQAAPLVPLALGALAAPMQTVVQYADYLDKTKRAGPMRLQTAALWIRDHAQPGDVVFNVNWDTFPRLFFWSPETYCVSGNDPVFLYAADPERYWITRQLESDALIEDGDRGFVCGNPPCPSDKLEDVHTAMVERFRASWVLLQRYRAPKLWAYLARDRRFHIAFQNGGETVFAVLP